MSAVPYPITHAGLPVQLARELMKNPDEDQIAEALRSAYATGYTQAIACLEPEAEWDLDLIDVADSRPDD